MGTNLPLLIYILALIPRLYHLGDTAVYPDEITWMVKGKEFIYALKALNLNYFANAWWQNPHDAYAIGIPLVFVNGLFHVIFAGAGKFSLHLFPDIIASRIPGALIGGAIAPAIYLYTTRFTNKKVGFLASITYALSPIALGLDRWILHDSFLTLFSFLCAFSYLRAGKEKKTTFLPGIWLSLSFLTKPTGILAVIPMIVVSVTNHSDKFHRQLFVTNIISFLFFTSIIWPASWLDPIFAIPKYLLNQVILVESGDPIHNFYMGVKTDNPHWSYYGFQLLSRLPEIIILTAVVSIPFFSLQISKKNKTPYMKYLFPLLIYFICFLAVISFSRLKGGVRYALPLIPWIYIASSWGTVKLIDKFGSRFIKVVIAGAFITLSLYPLVLFPNFYLYYNNFVGTQKNARKYDLVGLCFGTKASLEFLDKNKLDGPVGVIGCSATATYHTNRQVTADLQQAKYIILETAFTQTEDVHGLMKFLQNKHEFKQIFENGVQTASIYRLATTINP